jgi:hypothetical protein
MQTVKDFTIEELKAVIGEVVEEKLRQLLPIPTRAWLFGPRFRIDFGRTFTILNLRGRTFLRLNWPAAVAWNGRCTKLNSALERPEKLAIKN